MSIFTVTPNQLKAALLFASKKDVRYYLNGVCLEATATHTRMIATDGHRAIIINLTHDADKAPPVDAPVRYIVKREHVESAIKAFAKAQMLDIECNALECNINGIAGALIDGRFPEYERIVPRKVSGDPATYNTAYLNDMAKARALLGVAYADCVPVSQNGEGPALVKITDDALAVIMGVRGLPDMRAPEWFTGPVTAEPEILGARAALDKIHEAMNGTEWNADTFEMIAHALTAAGYRIKSSDAAAA